MIDEAVGQTIAWLRRAATLNDESVCLRLAKIYLQSHCGRVAAAELLEQVALSASQVSEED